MNVTLKQADRVIGSYMGRMQQAGWSKTVIQAEAMLEALVSVFGDEVTIVRETPEETPS